MVKIETESSESIFNLTPCGVIAQLDATVTKAAVEKFNILQFVAVEAQSDKCSAIRRLEVVFVAHMTRRLTESLP
jgi:hypothetical protein